ncbi:hypothetical protein OAT67_06720 [Bacteriovoracaceae bacterium]|nr:hypothetical protein [Bacteriovoracaceae bacterium]
MKSYISLVLILALLTNSTFSKDLDHSENIDCNNSFEIVDIQNITNLCFITIKSDLCKDIPEEDLLRCKKPRADYNEKNVWSFLKGCSKGLFESLKDTLSFVWEIMKWAWSNTTSSQARAKTSEASESMMNSAKLYLHTEYEKAYEESSSPFRKSKALSKMGGAIGSLIIDTVTTYIKKQYDQFDCLNQDAKYKKLCGLVGDVILPPAGFISLLKYGPKAASKFPNLNKLFVKKTPRQLKYLDALETFPKLKKVSSQISKKLKTRNKVSHPKNIPFRYSNGFRIANEKQMFSRAKELDPNMRNAIKGAYNSLNDPKYLKNYFNELHQDVVNWMIKKGRPEDLEMLEQGKVSRHAIGVVMVRRLKERGDNQFTTITAKNDLSVGRKNIDPEDLITKNKRFRTAIRTGPFLDRAFSDNFGHGIFSHMIQRDIVTPAITRNLGDPQKFWDYLGTPKGVNWWADLFDSVTPNSFTSPENLSKFIGDALNATVTKKAP